MAAATLPYTSVEEYLSSSYEPDVDYVDGQIEARNLGEIDQADLQSILVTLFRTHQKQWNLKAFTELRVQVSPTRFRVPDVTVVDASKPRSPIVHEAPVLCIEVLSPEDRFSRSLRKFRDYLTMGVPEVWVFDPEKRAVYVLHRNGAQTEHREGSLKLEGTPIEVSLAEVFSVLDEGQL